MKLLPSITELPVSEIIIGERIRPFSEVEVLALVDLIREFGQTTPILVRRTKSGYELVDGLHRLEATKRAGLETIPVRVYTMTDEDARLLEASQNLIGGLSPLDDAVFLAVWKKTHLEKHPETAGGVAGGLARQGQQRNSSSFAEIVANKRAISVRQVRKIIAAGERLGRNDLTLLRSAPQPMTLKDLEAIGKISETNERERIVSLLAAGAAKSVSEARRQIASESGVEAPEKDQAEAAFQALVKAWERAPMAARRRFMHEFADDLADLEGGAT